jgi:glycosyltransferase involved in cell wall biosynthesis
MASKKVTIVTSAFHPEVNGIAICAFQQADILKSLGFEAVVIGPNYETATHYRSKIISYPFEYLPYPSRNTFDYIWSPRPQLGTDIDKLVASTSPNLLLINEPDVLKFSALRSLGVKKNRGFSCPIIAFVHTDYAELKGLFPSNSLRNKIPLSQQKLRSMIARIYNQYDLTVCHTSKLEKSLGSSGCNNSTVMDTVFVDDFYRPIPQENKKLNKLLFIGRLSADKNFHNVVSLVVELMKNDPSLEFTVVGEGPLETSTQDIPKVHLYGPLEHSQLPEVLAQHDLLLQFSFSETLGLTALEAMASGVIPIVSNNSGVASLIPPAAREEILVDPNNLPMVKETILGMLKKDTKWELSHRLQQWVLSKYKKDVVRENFRQLLSGLMP